MNAITSNEAATPPVALLPAALFVEATKRVNAWRGQCQDSFARAEAAVTDTLVALAAVPIRGDLVTLPHLIGQRYEALSSALIVGGPFDDEGAASRATLERFREYDRLRTTLCHGVGKVSLDARGRWTLILRVLTLRGGKLCHDSKALDEAEAEQVRDDLCRTSRQLCSHLGHVRYRLVK